MRVVGVGQCGEVSECREIATDRKVVLRLMAPELTGNRITTELLLRHMMQLREFSHPNVVQVHDVQLHEGRLALVRDWVDGERLVDLLLREGALSVTHSLDVAIQVAEALEAAHKIDLLHLQLRPSNVFLEVGKGSALELARLVDFGIGPQRIVDGRDIFGTIRTLSPEQIEGWDPTLRSDVYSLGLLLYRMVTGRQPFAGTGDDVVRLALEETLPALRTPAGRPVPEALDILVHEMTEKRSSDRPRGMTEVIKRARKIQEAIEDELPFELAFREEHKSSGGGAYREQQTVIIRRSSIAPPPPEPGGKGRSPTPSVPPLFTPRGAERARRESMPPIPPPGMAGQEPADAPASPDESTDDDTIRIDPAMPTARREAHTIMWPALSQGVTKLSSPKGTAAAAKASAATSRAAGRGGSAAATGLMGAAQSAPAAQARLSSRSRRQARQRRHRRRVAGKAAAAGRKPQRTIMGHPAVTAWPARPAISPGRPPDEPTVPHGPGQFHGQEPERPPDTMRPTPLVGVEAPPPGPLKPTPYVGVSIPPPGALSDSEPVTMEGIPIPDSIPAGIPVDVVERAERGVQDVFPSGASAPLRPVSIEPPPLMAFGLEPGASLPDVIPARRIRAPPPNRTGLWIALGGLGAAVVAVAVWFLFLRGEGAAGPGAPSAAADAGAAVVAVAAADVGSGAAMDAAPSAEPEDAGALPDGPAEPDGAEATEEAAVDAAEEEGFADGETWEGEPDADASEAAAAVEATAVATVAEAGVDTGEDLEGDPSTASDEEKERISTHWVRQGNAELRRRQFAQARASYERALRFNPRNREARIGLGRAAFQQGQFAEAVRYLEPMYRSRGNMELGIAYVRVGRPADARAQFEKILARDPDNADAQRALRSLP